jgi:hypothetical protein
MALVVVPRILASWLVTTNNRSHDLPTSTYRRILVLQRYIDAAAAFDEKLATIAFANEVQEEVIARRLVFTERGRDNLDASAFDQLLRSQFGDISIISLSKPCSGIISFHPISGKFIPTTSTKIQRCTVPSKDCRVFIFGRSFH